MSISRKQRITTEETKDRISTSITAMWGSGKRKKSVDKYDWNSVQKDINNGMKRKVIYDKYGVTRGIVDYAFGTGILKKICG